MFEIPAGVLSPALLREEAGCERIVDLSEAKKLLKQRLVRQCGMVVRRVTNGIRKWKPKLPIFEVKRYSGALVSMSGESATMRPSKPSCRAIIRSGYAKRLDGFAHAHPPALDLFNAWGGLKISSGVPEALMKETHKGSILYMPSAGEITVKGTADTRKKREKIRGNASEGWQILEGNDNWEVCSADYVRELFERDGAELVAQELL